MTIDFEAIIEEFVLTLDVNENDWEKLSNANLYIKFADVQMQLEKSLKFESYADFLKEDSLIVITVPKQKLPKVVALWDQVDENEIDKSALATLMELGYEKEIAMIAIKWIGT